MKFFKLITALVIGLLPGIVTAEEGTDPQVVCTVQGCSEISIPKPRYSDANAFSVQQVWTVVNDILSVSGLSPNFRVVETVDVANAAAIVIDGERYLAFNPDWLSQYDEDPNGRWQLYGVMAHEVGHHLQGHTITGTGSKPPTELEADEYAGFTLSALGATLKEAQSLWVTLPASGSVTHPPRHQRLSAIERGWLLRKGSSAPEPVALPSSKPTPRPPQWTQRHCTPTVAANRSARLCVSSVLSSQSGNTYSPNNTLDRRSNTAWVEGVSGQGIGEAFTVVFDEPTRVTSLKLRNGYTKSNKTFFRNSRVRTLEVTASNGSGGDAQLRDTQDWQEIDSLSTLGRVSWIIFRITDVYPGSHYKDTAISELAFE